MFSKFCCQNICNKVQDPSEIVFSVEKNDVQSKYSREFREIDDITSDDGKYTRLRKSRYKQQVQQTNKKHSPFTDKQFPPNNTSLGNVTSRKKVVWKRIGQIVKHPIFIEKGEDEQDDLLCESSNYLLSTINTLARHFGSIERLFGSTQVSDNGIYMVKVNNMGVPQEVVVDDYFPVYDSTSQTVFAKPKQGRQIWQMVLEKAWAKTKGSYSNIQTGLPYDVLTAFSHAPCFYIDANAEQNDFLWLMLIDSCQNNFPTVASSKKKIPMDSEIQAQSTYCILGSYQLDVGGKVIGQVVKLLSTENSTFIGQYSTQNKQFWNQITEGAKKEMGFEQVQKNISFFMSFKQFKKYFDSINICHLRNSYNYNFEKVQSHKKSCYFEVDIDNDGDAYFTIHQSSLKSPHTNLQVYGKMTILVAKVTGEDYKYVVSKLQVNFPTLTVRCPHLQKGKYIVYTKCYRKHEKSEYSHTLSVYSQHRAKIKQRKKELIRSFFQRVFLDHAFNNPNKKYLESSKQSWVCSDLLYNEGGFAYVAANVTAPSVKKLRIEFDPRVFLDAGFKLKKPYSHQSKKKKIQASAGEPCILVCRITDHVPNSLVFPPELRIEQTL